jgi:hypothetical protein
MEKRNCALLKTKLNINILVTDQSHFHLAMRKGRSQENRRDGERYAYACLIKRRYFSGCSVMVWRGVKERGRKLLVEL